MFNRTIEIENVHKIPKWARNYLNDIKLLEPLRKLVPENRIKIFDYIICKIHNAHDDVEINCDVDGNVVFGFQDDEKQKNFISKWS